MPLIHTWFTYSIWNMDEICGLKFHSMYVPCGLSMMDIKKPPATCRQPAGHLQETFVNWFFCRLPEGFWQVSDKETIHHWQTTKYIHHRNFYWNPSMRKKCHFYYWICTFEHKSTFLWSKKDFLKKALRMEEFQKYFFYTTFLNHF